MNIAAIVILYHPDQNVVPNIQSYHPFVRHTYIFDNSEKENKDVTDQLRRLDNCTYQHDGGNKGIAARLNQGCHLARSQGYANLLTMDQDSSFNTTNLQDYFKCVDGYPARQQAAMFGVQTDSENQASGHCHARETKRLITSGSIVNLELFETLGGFDEKLFIDEVDTEYCFRAIVKGFHIIQFSNVFLYHSIGTVSHHRSLKSMKSTPRSLHSPVRLYYMARNYLYLRALYNKELPEEISFAKKSLLNRIKNNIIYNPKRVAVIKYILQGLGDFRKNKMGRYGN
jgi:rhamnosyltransferase